MRRNLIIMANSRKQGNRCIAGIDMQTSEWVRPVYGGGEQGVPLNIRRTDGGEPGWLDIVSIPLASDGPHRDIQPENRKLLRGAWMKVGKSEVGQIVRHCQKTGHILYNVGRRVDVGTLHGIPPEDRRSLCLVRAYVVFSTEGAPGGKKRVVAKFRHGRDDYALPVTDYDYERRFAPYSTHEADCLLVISLGMPYERDGLCYKFVAGVFELSNPP